MVDYRRSTRPPRFLSRREQLRLLMLVMALGLVVYMMREVARPEFWHWLWRGAPPEVAEAPNDVARSTVDDGEDAVDPAAKRRLTDEVDRVANGRPRRLADLDPELFAGVRDDAPFRGDAKPAWFALCAVLKSTPQGELAANSMGNVTYLQLADQPDVYRGRLVTIGGRARRAVYVEEAENDEGIAGYYQTWLQPAETGSDPVVVYVLELPEGFPIGEEIDEAVEVTGFFFKRWAYLAQDGIRTAPLLAARTVNWRPAAARPVAELPVWPIVVAGGLALCLVIIWFAWRQAPPKRASGESVEAGDTETSVRVVAFDDPGARNQEDQAP